MTKIRNNFSCSLHSIAAANTLHFIWPSVAKHWALYTSIRLNAKIGILYSGFSIIIIRYFNILLSILDFLQGFVFMNKKRGSDEQSTDQKQDKQNEHQQAKDSLNETLGKLKDLEQKDVGGRLDKGLPVRPKDYKEAKDLQDEFPDFFDEDSGNSENKKQGYSELKEYIEGELNALPSTKETSAVEQSNDRYEKKPKPSDESEGEAKPSSSEAFAKPSPSSAQARESSEGKAKGSLIDDYANPNNEFGDWTGGDD